MRNKGRKDRQMKWVGYCDDRNEGANSAIPVFIAHTQEDWAIAQECWKLA
jgi:hypothetical protein